MPKNSHNSLSFKKEEGAHPNISILSNVFLVYLVYLVCLVCLVASTPVLSAVIAQLVLQAVNQCLPSARFFLPNANGSLISS
jgi:hypothetical protein